MPTTGHSVVLGAAGSGKTTLALYRAAYLSESSMLHGGKTLLLTYNKLLTTYLKHMSPAIASNVDIRTYHSFALGYLKSRVKMSYNCVCENTKVYIAQAVKAVESKYKPSNFFKRPIEFFMDEIQWIFSNGFTSCDEYLGAKRIGRIGTRVDRKLRRAMYQILEKYIEIRNKEYMYDWDDIALHVRKELKADSSPRTYKHIIIDEGQDFSPEMTRSLVAAVSDDGSLTFFGDVAQQIYGQRISWRSAELKITKEWKFEEIYRNTKEISQLALSITKMPFFKGITDLIEPTLSHADGPLPILAKCSNEDKQIEQALNIIKDAYKTQSVAILFKNWNQGREISARFEGKAIRLDRKLETRQDGPGIYYGAYHSAKGLEFDMVILPFLDSENMPDKDYIASHDMDDADTYYGRLLYVAVTRAKTRLRLLYSNELTPLLPTDSSLYREIRR